MRLKLALVNIIADKNVYPINLACIATYLRKYLNFDLDIKIIDINYEDPIIAIMDYKPDVVGISSLTVRYGYAVNLARQIKEVLDIPVLIGGVHISTRPTSLSNHFDVGVIGEGEQTMVELMSVFKENGHFPIIKLKDISGIAFFDDDKLVMTNERGLITPLDTIPVPDPAFLNPEYFKPKDQHTFKGKIGIVGHILTSRGCPYKCVFCVSTQFWQKVRLFSAEHVVSEIKNMSENYGVEYIQIYDDLFTISKTRLQEILRGLEENNILGEVSFACQSRANVINQELCDVLKKLGVVTISFGFESGSERTLNYLKRGTVTVEQNRQAVRLCKTYGFYLYGSLQLGVPNEKIEDMEQTLAFIDFLKDNKADGVDVFVASPFPATEYWNYAVANNRIPEDYDLKAPDFYDPNSSMLLDKSVDKEEFRKIYEEANKKLSYFTHKRSIINVLRYPKESRLKILKKAILNPKEIIKRRLI